MAAETITVMQTTDTTKDLISARLVSIPPQLLPPLSSGKQLLQKLYLQDSNLQDAGVLTLVQSLQQQQHRLLVLNVARNAITNVGARALALGLTSFMAERGSSLYVYENEIETEGAQALLQSGQHLHAVWAWGNPAAPWAWRKCGDTDADGPHDIVRDLSCWQQRAAKAKTASPVVVEADAPVAVTEMVHHWQQAPEPILRHPRTASVSPAAVTELSPDKTESASGVQDESDDQPTQMCDVSNTHPPHQLNKTSSRAKNSDDTSTTPPQALTTSVSQTLRSLQVESARRKIRAASVRLSPDRKKVRTWPVSSHCATKDDPRATSLQEAVPTTAMPIRDAALKAQLGAVEEPKRFSEELKTRGHRAKLAGTEGSKPLSVQSLILKMNQRRKSSPSLPERNSQSPVQEKAYKVAASPKIDNVVLRSVKSPSAKSHDVQSFKDTKATPTSSTLSPCSVISQRESAQSNEVATPIAHRSLLQQACERVCYSNQTPCPQESSTPQPKRILRKSPSTTISATKVGLSTPRQEASSDKKPCWALPNVSSCSTVSPPRIEAFRSRPRNTPSHTETTLISKCTTSYKSTSPPLANAEKLVSLDPTVKMSNVSSELYARLQARLQRIAVAPPPLPVHIPEEVATKPVRSPEFDKLPARQQQRTHGVHESSPSSRQSIPASPAPRSNAESMSSLKRQPWSSRSTMTPTSPLPLPSPYHHTNSLQSPTSPQSELQARLQQRFHAIENSIPALRAPTSPQKIVAGHEATSSGSLSSFRLRKKLSLGY